VPSIPPCSAGRSARARRIPATPTVHSANGNQEPAFGSRKGEKKEFPHLYFHVADINAACARVVELGGKAAVPAESASGHSVTVSDDQGVSFGLWQPSPGLAD